MFDSSGGILGEVRLVTPIKALVSIIGGAGEFPPPLHNVILVGLMVTKAHTSGGAVGLAIGRGTRKMNSQ